MENQNYGNNASLLGMEIENYQNINQYDSDPVAVQVNIKLNEISEINLFTGLDIYCETSICGKLHKYILLLSINKQHNVNGVPIDRHISLCLRVCTVVLKNLPLELSFFIYSKTSIALLQIKTSGNRDSVNKCRI